MPPLRGKPQYALTFEVLPELHERGAKTSFPTEDWLLRHRSFNVKVPSIFNFQLLLLGHLSAGYAHCLPGTSSWFLVLNLQLISGLVKTEN